MVSLKKVSEIDYASVNNLLNSETRGIVLLMNATVNNLPNLMHKFYECLTTSRDESSERKNNNNNNNNKIKKMASRNPGLTMQGMEEDAGPTFDAHLREASPYEEEAPPRRVTRTSTAPPPLPVFPVLDDSILGDGGLEQSLARGYDEEGLEEPDFGFLPTAPKGTLEEDAGPIGKLEISMSAEEVRKENEGQREGNERNEMCTGAEAGPSPSSCTREINEVNNKLTFTIQEEELLGMFEEEKDGIGFLTESERTSSPDLVNGPSPYWPPNLVNNLAAVQAMGEERTIKKKTAQDDIDRAMCQSVCGKQCVHECGGDFPTRQPFDVDVEVRRSGKWRNGVKYGN